MKALILFLWHKALAFLYAALCIAGIADVRFVVQRDQRAENTQSTHTVCDQENWLWLFLQKVIFSVAPCE